MKGESDSRRLERLRDYHARERSLPTYQGIADLLGYASTSAAAALVNRLVETRHLRKGAGGRVVPGARFFERLLSNAKVPAGSPIDLDDVGISTIEIDRQLVRFPSRTFVVQIEGESMIEAGLLDKDFVVAERDSHCRHGDIVVAFVDGRVTIKYLQDVNGEVFLRPANKAYNDIRPRMELQILGLVIGSFRKMI